MMDPVEENLRSTDRKRLAGLIAVATLGLCGAAYHLTADHGSRGKPEQPDHVLIVGPHSDQLEGWLSRRGFTTRQMNYTSAVAAGQEVSPRLNDLDAVTAFADEHGYGYVGVYPAAVHDYGSFGLSGEAPHGATVAVVSVGDLANPPTVTFGVPSSQVTHDTLAGQKVGLLLALFEQPQLAHLRDPATSEPDPSIYARFDENETLSAYDRIAKSQRAFDAYDAHWVAATRLDHPRFPTKALGKPYQTVDAYPLNDGGVLVLASEPSWHSHDGVHATLQQDVRSARYIGRRALRGQDRTELSEAGTSCDALDKIGIRDIRVNTTGDAVAVQRRIADGDSEHWAVQFAKYSESAGTCPLALAGYPLQSRQKFDLGPPHPVGAMLMVADRVRFGFKGRERFWRYPVFVPDGGAAAWVDGRLVVYAGGSAYEDSDAHGLAFMSALTEERLELFVPMSTLLPTRDPSTAEISAVRPLSGDRFLVVVEDREQTESSLLEVEFTRSVRGRLHQIDHTGDLPRQARRATVKTRSGLRVRTLIDPLPDLDSGTFDQAGTKLAYTSRGQAFVLPLDGQPAIALTPADHGAVDARVAADGRSVLYHRNVDVVGETVRTGYLVEVAP